MNIFGRKVDRTRSDAIRIDPLKAKEGANSLMGGYEPPRHPGYNRHTNHTGLNSERPKADLARSSNGNHQSLSAKAAEDFSGQNSTSQTTLAAKSDIVKAHKFIDVLRNEIRSSVDQQQRSVVRVQGLAAVLEQIELKFTTYQRMERRLLEVDKTNTLLTRDLAQSTKLAEELGLRLKTVERQYLKIRTKLESAQSDLATQNDFMRTQRDKLLKLKSLLSDAATKITESENRNSGLSSAQKRLQAEFHSQSLVLSKKSRQIVELQKSFETVSLKLNARTKENEVAQVEMNALKSEHADVKSRFFDTNTTLENARYDFNAQKAVLDNQLQRREEENLTLKSQIENLSTQVRVAGNMSAHRDREIVDLQSTIETERERIHRTEARLAEKSQQADMNGRALERAKIENEILNEKFASALADVEMLRAMALSQNEKLSRYAAVAGSYDPNTRPEPSLKLSPPPENALALAKKNVQADGDTYDPKFKLKAIVNPKLNKK